MAQRSSKLRVTAIQTVGGKVTGVSTDQGDFNAPIVINAAGPWAKHVASLAGIERSPLDVDSRCGVSPSPAVAGSHPGLH
jgi:glycine/D-amino acid oxidase-like deaminating enzyme